MPTQYTLEVTNHSTQLQDFCLYQQPVGLGVPGALPLAWMVKSARPDTTVTFTWTETYTFVWGETGAPRPGVTFVSQQTVPADPDSPSSNQIQFDFRDGAFTFVPGPVAGAAQLGSLYIRELSSIPPNIASVGIGMSNAGVFVVPAEPNMTQVFTPHPEYWLTAGTFSHGGVIDVDQISNPVAVPFDGTFTRRAVLDANNLWTVS